jgi:ribosomal protein S18 acetylase RimI-like enzyme
MLVSAWLRPLSSQQISEIAALSTLVFAPPAIDHEWRLTQMPDTSVFVALDAERLIGFKAGYAIVERKYYSWLGAVHPDFRNRGIATQLAHAQHAWLVQRKYSAVETATLADNPAMAKLNLNMGFLVVGSKLESHGLKVLWAKRLPEA